ncbi:hypothetical protein Hs30E_05880 [Lactococcus hodotermopsidis]|uniref:ABC transporter permease n=1 Tax=Pseudolactococcus hodotermopsidis TaxID=2709157 RepID=A0A6A0BDX9_9LACT|nr:putative ABC transporter permease [Lactococcus hodotermopsidis]GFH42037.1 hypothetical protein Hs30E_05880 [Lactococcus hodotermopsidis]
MAKLNKLFWLFIIGSVFGFVLETVFCFLVNGRLECRSSLIFGPFNIIYGLAMVMLYLGKYLVAHRKLRTIFLFGAITSTILEYVVSIVQEMLIGSVSWDYSSQPFNIDGRVSLLFSVFWGILTIIWYLFVLPFLEKTIDHLSQKIKPVLTKLFILFLVLDLLISGLAVVKWHIRQVGPTSKNTTIDKILNDTLMEKIYPNMIWKD